MKKIIILSIALLNISVAKADDVSVTDAPEVVHNNVEQEPAVVVAQEDPFNDLMDSDVPSDMLVAPKPVSPLEAWLKSIGVCVLIRCIACKIWVEHQCRSVLRSVGGYE